MNCAKNNQNCFFLAKATSLYGHPLRFIYLDSKWPARLSTSWLIWSIGDILAGNKYIPYSYSVSCLWISSIQIFVEIFIYKYIHIRSGIYYLYYTGLNWKLPSSASTSTSTLAEVSFNLHFSCNPPTHPNLLLSISHPHEATH